MDRRKLVAGNWKMNGLGRDIAQLDAIVGALSDDAAADVLICPPVTLVASFAMRAKGTRLSIGAQDCHAAPSGAHTGDVSAPMLADAGATHVIVGHSERRADHGETDEQVHAKVRAAWTAGLVAIICVGETGEERDAGQAGQVVDRQLAGSVPEGANAGNTVIAYEPVWAIGTGRTPSLADIAEMHARMRAHAQVTAEMRLLYGGSVKAGNAEGIFALEDVDGALVGGASLKADDFLPICAAAENA